MDSTKIERIQEINTHEYLFVVANLTYQKIYMEMDYEKENQENQISGRKD